jgi:hypothetical protein
LEPNSDALEHYRGQIQSTPHFLSETRNGHTFGMIGHHLIDISNFSNVTSIRSLLALQCGEKYSVHVPDSSDTTPSPVFTPHHYKRDLSHCHNQVAMLEMCFLNEGRRSPPSFCWRIDCKCPSPSIEHISPIHFAQNLFCLAEMEWSLGAHQSDKAKDFGHSSSN